MDILKKIWNMSVTVGQVIVTALVTVVVVGTVGVVVWGIRTLFRPSKE